MEMWMQVGLKVAGSAVLGFAGNVLEEQGNKALGKALGMASAALSAWAVKDFAVKAIHESADDDRAV